MQALTAQEKLVVTLLGNVYTEFLKLEPAHPYDHKEFVHAIHAAQNIVLARLGLRQLSAELPEL